MKKIVKGGLTAGSPVSKAIPKRVRSDDSPKTAIDDSKIRKTGNPPLRMILNVVISDEAQNLGTMTEGKVDLFREHLMSEICSRKRQ